MTSVYFIAAPTLDVVKIGTTSTLAQMRKAARRMCPAPTVLLGTLAGDLSVERALHRRFHAVHVHGEWYRLSLIANDIARLIEMRGADLVEDIADEQAARRSRESARAAAHRRGAERRAASAERAERNRELFSNAVLASLVIEKERVEGMSLLDILRRVEFDAPLDLAVLARALTEHGWTRTGGKHARWFSPGVTPTHPTHQPITLDEVRLVRSLVGEGLRYIDVASRTGIAYHRVYAAAHRGAH